MKVSNTEFKRHTVSKKLKELCTGVPELLPLLDHEIVTVDTRMPNYDAKHTQNIGGIDVTVQYDCVTYHNNGERLRFGVRTDQDGMIDIGKLIKKFRANLDKIRKFIEIHERNIRIRRELREKRVANGEILSKLKDEGLIKSMYEFDEKPEGFKTTLTLKDEEELRAFIAFKKRLEERRDMTEQEKKDAQGRADHGVIS